MTEAPTPGATPAPADVSTSKPAAEIDRVQSTTTDIEEPASSAALAPVLADAEPAEAPVEKISEAHQKAFNKIAFERRDFQRQLMEQQALNAELLKKAAPPAPAAPNGDGSDPAEYVPRAELDRLANERADRIAADKHSAAQAEASAASFNKAADDVYAAGTKDFPDFENAVSNLRMLGHMNYATVEAAMATDNPQKVLYEIGKNAAEAERIMALPPFKMAIEFAKLAAKAPPKKEVSSAPAPITPLEGTTRISDDLNDSDSDLDWGKKFEKKFYANR